MSSYNWAQEPVQENKDKNGLVGTASFPWWVRDPFICHQWIPLQMWGHFLPGKRYSPAFLNHQSGDLRDVHDLPQLHTVEPHLQDSATSFWAHTGMPENVTILRDAGWIDGLTKVSIYLVCTNQHQKIAVLATLILDLSGSGVVSYPVTCKQQKQTNVRFPGCPGALTAEQIKDTSFKVVILLLKWHWSSHKRGSVAPHEV